MRSRQFAHTATGGVVGTAWSRAARSSAASIARAAEERRTSKIVSDRCARSERRRFSLSYASIARSYFRCQGCVTFWIRGLQVSLTKTKDKVFWSGRLNLYTPCPLQFLGIEPARRVF